MKRTFGLVGDYGCGSSSEDEEEIVEKKKVKQPVEDPKDSIEPEDDHIDSEKNNPSEAAVSAKWKGVRKEYEDSSLMFKYMMRILRRKTRRKRSKEVLMIVIR